MFIVDAQPGELRHLTGREDESDEEFKDGLSTLGLEFGGVTDDGAFQLGFGPDHLDHLSVKGVAHSLRYQYGDTRGVPVPSTNDPDWTFIADGDAPNERLYVTSAVIRGIDLDDAALDSLIQLWERLHMTMGHKYAKGAIGIHNPVMLKDDMLSENASGNSITYTGIDPDNDIFIVLDSNDELVPAEAFEQHTTGRKCVDLVSEHDCYPAIYDEISLFSLPLVINSRRTEVPTGSRDLLVELTGADQRIIGRMYDITCCVLAAHGVTIEEVEVQYETGTTMKPNFEVETKHASHDRIETVLGTELELDEITDLSECSGLDTSAELGEGTAYEVSIPSYHIDVPHLLNLIDDVDRTYDSNEFEPRYPDVGMVGQRHERSQLEDAVHISLVSLGFEDLLNLHMISEEENYERMDVGVGSDCLDGGGPTSITELYSGDYTTPRTWVLSPLTMVLENNTHRAYPQDLVEIGHVAHHNNDGNTHVAEARHVAVVLARHNTTYEDAKTRLATLYRDFNADLETPATDHPSFIDGRTATVVIDGKEIGAVGELHPRVTVKHGLRLPVVAFEFDLSALA